MSAVFCCIFLCFFFFQAEDGIRDLVRSRGLGDVYKRQVNSLVTNSGAVIAVGGVFTNSVGGAATNWSSSTPVSYTHLTLPTSDLV